MPRTRRINRRRPGKLPTCRGSPMQRGLGRTSSDGKHIRDRGGEPETGRGRVTSYRMDGKGDAAIPAPPQPSDTC